MNKRNIWFGIAGAVTAGCLMLFLPLLRSFHLDSAIVAGVAGAFTGAWMAARPNGRDRDVLALLAIVYVASVPLVILDAAVGCLSADGAAFWAAIPVFSVLFGFSAGRAIRLCGVKGARWYAVVFIFLVAAGGVLLPLLQFPQLFFFNHVFGYWPGAIYDQAVVFPGRIGLYRLITLTWIALFWLMPHLSGSDRIIRSIFALLLFSLALNYLLASENGLISSESRIQSELGGAHQTEHFTLYYSKQDYSTHEIAFLARLHEFHFRELADTLKVSWPEGKRINSYLYGDEWQMQRLTGAKGVSFAPVWQRTPQVHMRKAAIDGTLRHELVHVIAREFGNRFLNASWSIGMVEGLAVALAPASSARLTSDQLVLSNDAFYSGEELERLFSLTGFYRESGPVAYAVSGSFTATLLREYPVERFKDAYRSSSLRKGYGRDLQEAITKWHRRVADVRVTEEEKKLAETVFAIPSLFDVHCPRKLTLADKNRDAFRLALERGDTARAIGYLERVLRHNPDWDAGWMQWMRLQTESGYPESVIERIEGNQSVPDHPLLSVRFADACIAAGHTGKALEIRREALDDGGISPEDGELTISDAVPSVQAVAWELRSDPDRWEKLVRILYMPDLSLTDPPGFLVDTADATLVRVFFAEWFRRNPVPSSDKIPKELIPLVLKEPIDPAFFEVYRNLIYLVSTQIEAGYWMDKLSDTAWRPSRQARLDEALRFAGS